MEIKFPINCCWLISMQDNTIIVILYGTGSKTFKSGFHVSRKDRKHRFENMFFKLSSYGLVSMW